MLKIRRPLGRLIFNMGIAIPGKTVFLIETAPRSLLTPLPAIRWPALTNEQQWTEPKEPVIPPLWPWHGYTDQPSIRLNLTGVKPVDFDLGLAMVIKMYMTNLIPQASRLPNVYDLPNTTGITSTKCIWATWSPRHYVYKMYMSYLIPQALRLQNVYELPDPPGITFTKCIWPT